MPLPPGFARPLLLSALLVAAFYTWCRTPDPAAWPGRFATRHYYPSQVDGWLAGRLDLKQPVPAGLTALVDPYDPSANQLYRSGNLVSLHDVSLFQGKLYLYWGPTPGLIAFLPWRLLTGRPLSTSWATAGFAFGAWLASAWLLTRVAQKYFPRTPSSVLSAGFVGLAVCSWAPVILRRASVWEVPIAAACCFGALAWWLLAESTWAKGAARERWLAAASLSLGLAVGARPIWIVSAGILLVPLWVARREWREKIFRRLVLAAALPFGVCVVALVTHNLVRFGQPLEFGQRWQLGGDRVDGLRLFGPEYVTANLREYFFSIPQLTDYFPFIQPPAPHAWPPGHLGNELTYGLLIALPWLWLAALAPAAARVSGLGRIVVILAITSTMVNVVLAGFAGITARYEMEIAGPLALLAAIGLLIWEAGIAARPWFSWSSRVVWATMLTGSFVVTLAVNWQFMGLFEAFDPDAHASLARVANRTAITVGRLPKEPILAVELTVLLPSQIPDERVEILACFESRTTLAGAFLRYLDSENVTLGVFYGHLVGESVALRLDRTKTHLVRIELGGALPPPAHPFWGNLDPDDVTRRRKQYRIVVDGAVLLAGQSLSFEPINATPVIGTLPPGTVDRQAFTGKILSQRMVRTSESSTLLHPQP